LPKPAAMRAWQPKPFAGTEPRVQRLCEGSYPERGMEPYGLAGAGLCMFSASSGLDNKYYEVNERDLRNIKSKNSES